MKKLLLLLFLLPLGFLGSCSDDDDNVPDCDITVVFDNVAEVDGQLYVTQDTDFGVQSITATSTNGKKAIVANVVYAIDYLPLGGTIVEPYTATFDTQNLAVGTGHVLGIGFQILQVDKSIFNSRLSYKFNVVPTVEDIPGGAELGTYTDTFHIAPK